MKQINILWILFFFFTIASVLIADENKKMLTNISTLGYEVSKDGKSWIDSKTGYKISTCSDNFNLSNKLGIKNDKNEPACAKTEYYEGACWVTNLGFTGGDYKAEVCYQSPSNYVECHTLSNGQSLGKFELKMRSLSYTDPYYTGSFETKDEQDCPDYEHDINSFGYVYIKEATDEQYFNALDFSNRFCQPLSEKYNPNNCSSPQMCPCDNKECRENNFIPPKTSEIWKNASQKTKNCYLCLQNYRAVNFYCNKIYRCLNNNRRSYAYELAKNKDYRKYIDDLYGEGSYLCGYYDGKLCGCGKTKLSAGPRHFLRIAKKASSLCETKEDLISNPQCNLFSSGIHARQFYNDFEDHSDEECPYKISPEFGYKNRGTFFSPKITIVSGKNERLIGYNSSLLLEKEDYYYNQPIGVSEDYILNNKYNIPTAKKILFSNFYPVIFTIGSLSQIKNEDGKCLLKASGDLSYVMLRLEYNLSTNESALVAYKVRFINEIPPQLTDNMLLLSDGSISKFIIENTEFIENIRNAKTSPDEKIDISQFKYDFDPNSNFSKDPIKENGRYLYFENIGKVSRPPLKYSYDEGSIYINTPLVLEQDLTSNSLIGEYKLKISLIPSKLSSFDSDEFESDKKLAPVVKQITLAGYNKKSFSLIDDKVINKSDAGISSDAIMYMKRFSVKYNNSCVFLKTMNDPGQDEYLLKNPPSDISECSNINSLEKKMACIVSFISLYECNGYINCLDKDKSISECQTEDRKPKIKLLGTDSDLPEYKKNIDFRSYTQICVNDGFEFADRLSEYSNTKLFGDFGYAPYDYTIRWKKKSNGINSMTPGRPLSIRYNDVIKEPEEFQDKPKDIITMDIDYFSSDQANRKSNMLRRLRGVYMINNSNGMPSNKTAYEQYASDCSYNQSICFDRYEVKHRLINETLGTLCLSAGDFNNQGWDLQPRDFGVDYNIYIPLRCQYVYFNGVGAGGAGFTTEKYSNCLVQYHVIESSWYLSPFIIPLPMPGFPSGAYLRTPKFDATGSQGGEITAKINLNLLPVFDGYLAVTTGTRTAFSRASIIGKNDDDPEKCFIGVSPYHAIDINTRDWMVRGGTHGFWYLNYNSAIQLSGDNAVLQTPQESGVYDIEKYYDYRKGNSEIAFDTYGGKVSKFDKKAYILSEYEIESQKLENLIDNDLVKLITQNKKYRLLEFYFISLMHLSYRLQNIDNALFETQKIALNEVKKQYENNLNTQYNLKKNEEENRKNAQEQLNDILDDIEECKNIDPSTGRTISGKTKEECDEINQIAEALREQIKNLDDKIDIIQNEIDRLSNIINNNLYPENEIKSFDVLNSFDSDKVIALLKSINDDIKTEKDSWIGENATEVRSIQEEKTEIDDLKKNFYNETTVQKLKDVVNTYINNISYVSNIKTTYCNLLENIATNVINVDYLKPIKAQYEAQIDNLFSILNTFEDELLNEKKLLKELFTACKQHTNNLIELAHSKPKTYIDEIMFRHSNDYGLLKSVMCLAFDKNKTNCDENISISSHSKIEDNINLCEATKIVELYNTIKEKIYINNSVKEETVCYKVVTDDTSRADESDYCAKGDDNCECKTISYNITERITDGKLDSNISLISSKFEPIQNQESIVTDLANQLDEIDREGDEEILSSYQYLATATRGSSPIDARIKRKRQGQGNVPYWSGENIVFGDATMFQANLFGKTIDGRLCYSSGLYDVAYKHDYICLHQKDWIEGKRKIVINDGYGYANENYTFDAISKKNTDRISRSSTISTELDHRAMLGSYEKFEGMSGNGPGSKQNHDAIKGKWNEYEESQSAGGSFHHLQGAGGGGPGSTKVSLSLIGVKQFEYNGDLYPELNNDGTKKVINEDKPDNKCVIKCPPMNVLVKDFEFFFPEINKTAKIDMVCEYSGEPEHDMESVIGTSVAPKKCYIMTESISGVGNVKGKIIVSSDGICPITKCANEIWGFNAQPKTQKNISQYDRNTGICKPYEKYGNEKKTSKYFMMMFDKNVYSGLAYKGSRTATLTSSLPQNINGEWKLNSYEIASCSETKIGGYVIDTYDQLSSLDLNCSIGGFWASKSEDHEENTLFGERSYEASCMTDEDKYENCIISNSYDNHRNNDYKMNNSARNIKEYMVKNYNYILGQKNGNEFKKPSDTDISISGVYRVNKKKQIDEEKIINGRTVFKDKIKCPMLDSDKYDFDNDYTGNAIWDFADEFSTAKALRCKENSIQISSSLPTRVCKVNGLWGPVINPCYASCKEEVDKYGVRWFVTNSDIVNLKDKETSVTVSRGCVNNYLNSQNYENPFGEAKRTCNLLTSTWGKIENSKDCSDGLICINDEYNNKKVATPYARTMIFTKSNQYKELIEAINNGYYSLSDKTEYKDNLYIIFEQGKKYSSTFGYYYQADNDYVNVEIEEKNFDLDGDMYITDAYGNRLINRLPNNDYYVISVNNTLRPKVLSYIFAQDDETKNEFLNIENWVSRLKEDRENYTGMWSWKANLSKIKSITVKDTTNHLAQESYKNSKLLIFIPKLIDGNKNLRHIALFSPYLAKSMGAGDDIVPSSEENIKFRYLFNIDNSDLINNEQYAITVYNGISSSSRLYWFEWEKNDNKDWVQTAQTTHYIGSRNCNGKYFGYIKHNSTKHIMYTPEPTSSNQVFASLFCYDGRIFGFHAFRSNIYQEESLTDNNTKSILLSNNVYGYDGAKQAYEFMKSYFSTLDLKNDYFSDTFDVYCEGPKNAYIFSMMAKYWQSHILPLEQQQEYFAQYYRPGIDLDYRIVENKTVKEIMENYAKGNKGFYYRILPRRADWISGISALDTIDNIYDVAIINNNDPYCINTECLQQKANSDALNKVVNEQTWEKCELVFSFTT